MFQGKSTRKKKEKSKNNYKSPIEVFSKNQAHKHALILNNDKKGQDSPKEKHDGRMIYLVYMLMAMHKTPLP